MSSSNDVKFLSGMTSSLAKVLYLLLLQMHCVLGVFEIMLATVFVCVARR